MSTRTSLRDVHFIAFPDTCLLWHGDFFKLVVGVVSSCFSWWCCRFFLQKFLILILTFILYSSCSFLLIYSHGFLVALLF